MEWWGLGIQRIIEKEILIWSLYGGQGATTWKTKRIDIYSILKLFLGNSKYSIARTHYRRRLLILKSRIKQLIRRRLRLINKWRIK